MRVEGCPGDRNYKVETWVGSALHYSQLREGTLHYGWAPPKKNGVVLGMSFIFFLIDQKTSNSVILKIEGA